MKLNMTCIKLHKNLKT